MIRRGAALLLIGLVPFLAGCPPQPKSAPGAAAPDDWATAMLNNVNAQRAASGLGPIALCGTLNNAAQAHSADQAARATMSHIGGDGSNLSQRAGRAGYNGWTNLGENVAYGYGSVDGVMVGWMSSPGHRANILSGDYTHLGVGRAGSGGVDYWTQVFGRNGTC